MKPLVYRHNRVTRLTHWINGIALTILFMSGLQIFNGFPHLHWGSKAEPEEALFSISSTNQSGDVRCYAELFGYRIPTTTVLFRAGSRFRATSGWPVDAVGTSSLVSCSPSMGFFILSTIL